MTTFAPCAAGLPSAPADPARRVYYTHGLVLGVAELTQEFAYLAGRDQWAIRDLIGSGTVSGLQVDLRTDGTDGPRIVVSAGVAVSPSGRLIRITSAQQAFVNQWLVANRAEVSRRADIELGSPPTASVELHLVLCYRERLTAPVPGPGTPCRSEDVATTPSRVADDFALELRLDRPFDRERAELTRFIGLVPQIEVVEDGGVTRDEYLDALRLALASASSPPATVPPLIGGSPPSALRVRADDLADYLAAALRLWITEVRPQVQTPFPDPAGCATASENDCVVLATLRVPVAFVGDGWQADESIRIVVDEDERPLVGHLQLLQEWLLRATRSQPAGAAVVAAGRLQGAMAVSSLGGLRVTGAAAAGRVKITFNQYRAPSGSDDYIVKALPSRLSGGGGPVAIDFGGFEADGFVLLATRAGTDLSIAELASLELQVEVSRV